MVTSSTPNQIEQAGPCAGRSRFPQNVRVSQSGTYLNLVMGDIEMQTSVQNVVRANMFTAPSGEPFTLLRELFELLEDYAPTWYTEELHNRAAAALGEFEPALS
jgi:hypothetical protein